MILLLAALPFTDVTASAVADRTAVRLSESVRLTLTVEGPAPLSVTVPEAWLTPESAATWRARAAGPADVAPLPGGRERWAITLRLDPYATGDPLPVTLNPTLVRSGTDAAPRPVDWTPPAIRVTSELIEASAAEARPITGIESVPRPERPWGWAWVAGATVLLATLAATAMRRRTRRTAAFDGTRVWVQQIEEIEREADPRELARLVSTAVRDRLDPEFTFRTTGEIRRSASSDADALALLGICERVHFDPDAASEASDLKARALEWLRAR